MKGKRPLKELRIQLLAEGGWGGEKKKVGVVIVQQNSKRIGHSLGKKTSKTVKHVRGFLVIFEGGGESK